DAHVAPRTPVERRLAEIFQELLGVGDVGVHDDFFALGGSSIVATRLAARVREVFAVEVSLVDVLAASTVDELARLVDEA
ncbi:phosphopantetheine-binding protein, partial [Nonomuraea sp. NPDC003201]